MTPFISHAVSLIGAPTVPAALIQAVLKDTRSFVGRLLDGSGRPGGG